jgi:hypothetical protein
VKGRFHPSGGNVLLWALFGRRPGAGRLAYLAEDGVAPSTLRDIRERLGKERPAARDLQFGDDLYLDGARQEFPAKSTLVRRSVPSTCAVPKFRLAQLDIHRLCYGVRVPPGSSFILCARRRSTRRGNGRAEKC